MKKSIFFIMLAAGVFTTALLAYSDADMDGVADAVDKCPNTPFMALVDINGCTKSVLLPSSKKEHYDIIVGVNYSGSNFNSLNQSDTISSSLQVDYYYNQFSLQASTSYFTTDADGYSDSGLNDSFVGGAYSFKVNKNLLVRAGAGLVLPTYDASNNNMDYTASLNVSYTKGKYNLFGGYIYTMINDDDIVDVAEYQNTEAVSLGAGYYFTNKFYMSLSYSTADSIYKGVEDVDTLSLYGYKSIDKNWFMTFYYAYGLSDSASDNAASIKLGYYY